MMLQKFGFFISVLLFCCLSASAQVCTGLGQNPGTAFPVCGTTSFQQDSVPICSSNSLYVPGCDAGGLYANKNPYWYTFTCFETGTLGFLITPANLDDDYDWQLYDITGLDPNEVYTNRNIIVCGNWAGTSGLTGASAAGTRVFTCGSDPASNVNTFSSMPTIIEGHVYLLLISHFTDSQSGYSLSFGGGTGVITDPALPDMISVSPDCDGTRLTVAMSKRMRCNSVTALGTEFSLSPALATVTGATPLRCNTGFDFDTLVLTLSNPLPTGQYNLVIHNGSDGTTILDDCQQSIPENKESPFEYLIPQPIFADSIGTPGCAPSAIRLYFPKRIDCSTIAADGSDFNITGPASVNIIGASASCSDGLSSMITIRFDQPISDRGVYTLFLRAGTDGTTVIDECGIAAPEHTLTFSCADTVSANFEYQMLSGCRENTIQFSHDGANQVNSWNWLMNANATVNTQTHQVRWPATSTNNIRLIVSNGVCRDTVTQVLELNNEVKAAFEMPPVICPEETLTVLNQTRGVVDNWSWNFERIAFSNERDPAPVLFPTTNREAYYSVSLRAENLSLGCADSVRQTLRVLSNCFIAVPTAFTPNNDGVNDYLYPNNAIKALNLNFRVFNRWGQLVFETRNWTDRWDGNIKGIPQGAGVYAWFLSYTHPDTGQPITQKGTTTLIR